jgi:predicted lipid-binding transport protein (Tim44 family)
MPRRTGKSSSRSSSSAISAPRAKPSNNNNQSAKPSMGSSMFGMLMTGMAFGAGMELIRGLFRHGNTDFFPIIAAGGLSFGTYKLLKYKRSNYALPAAGVVLVGTYILLKDNNKPSENENYDH